MSQVHEHEHEGAAHDHGSSTGPGHDDHGHSHGSGSGGHAGHSHGVSADADRRYLLGALALIAAYMVGEVILGFLAHSLALISDAGHMLTDAASLLLALLAMRLSARPARGSLTFGLKRAEILSAQANGITLLALGAIFSYEAIRRLLAPPTVEGGIVLVTALVGIVVNVIAAWLISRANRSSLNVEGAYQHILNDAWAFIATAAAGLVVLLTGFTRADAIATLVVAALMFHAGYGLVRESGRIFLEAAPAGLDPDAIGTQLVAEPGVVEVHDLHVWTITSGYPALSAHVLVRDDLDCHAVRARLEASLRSDHHIQHTTLQVDHATPELLQLGAEPDAHCVDPHGSAHRAGGER
ncbi:cation diffusion facilitator family transporter [Streptacidiphilus sp. PB12-B1b]|uniref:cation diffusion facilitator family transporter n=1 Tax=Streptacidiphilus sp. PB12-B1b TaxID=2705012 RepID=UPI001CDC546B|nr:cation diffusion facilitator family transporter [Streptacidiphilus sp. PB12-B1b]